MKNSKPKLVLWYDSKSTFIQKDIDSFNEKYAVIERHFKPKKNLLLLIEFFKQFILTCKDVFNTKYVVLEFSGYHSLIPSFLFKLFGKQVLIISAGTDCVSFPSIAYGNFQNKTQAWFTGKSFKNAHYISPVHKSLIYYKYTYNTNDIDPIYQGYRAFVKNIKAIDIPIPYGFSQELFYDKGISRIPNSFITISSGLSSNRRFVLKGIDLFIEMARKFSTCTFTIVGGTEIQQDNLPKNLILKPLMPNHQLVEILNEHEFYCQLSISEGFPNALCEAMLSGCIPIVSDVSSLAEIVGDTGFILHKKEVDQLVELIHTALQSNKSALSHKAAQKIIQDYLQDKRTKALLTIFK